MNMIALAWNQLCDADGRQFRADTGGDRNAVDISPTVWYVVYLPKEGGETHESKSDENK